jgi:hypothetical protein
VDEAALKIFSIFISARNEINPVDFAKTKLLEDTLHPLPADVSENTRDADAKLGHDFKRFVNGKSRFW